MVCIASGPSITADDCAHVHEWRRAEPGRGVIAVNTSFRCAPFADVLYAMDGAWWLQYGAEVRASFQGECYSATARTAHVKKAPSEVQRNSGAGAIALAASLGAKRILLLGYDCQIAGGRAHWHDDHPGKLGNAGSVDQWPAQFAQLSRRLRGVEIVNCSRETALEVFPRAPLALALGGGRRPVFVKGMHGLGDNLHQRSVIRELVKENEVWLETPWPCLYHDLDVHLVSKGSKLRTQAKNAAREAAAFENSPPPAEAKEIAVSYPPKEVARHGSVLAAMSAQCGVATGDFSLPVPQAWHERAQQLIDQWQPAKPLMILRPLVERTEWGGCKARNPEAQAYAELYASIRERFFVVSVADLAEKKEWLAADDMPADVVCHAGELDIEVLAALVQRASLVFTSPGFAVVLAQAVGTRSVCVFGGYENATSFSAGAVRTPTLCIEPIKPCSCFSHKHKCQKAIDLPAALQKLQEFVNDKESPDGQGNASEVRHEGAAGSLF